MTRRPSRALALAGLAALVVMLLAGGTSAATVLGVAPLAGLVLAGLMPWRRWAITTAVLMLPYFSYGMMETITSAAARGRAVVFTLLSVGVLLAAFDDSRRWRE